MRKAEATMRRTQRGPVGSIGGLLAMLLFFAGACAPTLTVQRMKPAEVDISSYKKVALGSFSGRGADQIVADLTQALFNSARFEVLDRSNMNMILREQNLSVSDSFDPGTAVQLGKLVGSAALITGNVTARNYNEGTSSKQGTCTRTRDGKQYEYTCTTYYISGDWQLNVNMSVTDTSTGRIIATRSFREDTRRSNSATDERPARTWDSERVFGELEDKVIRGFMRVIAPYTVNETVKIYTSKKLPTMKAGLNCCKAGTWSAAAEHFRTAIAEADRDPDIKPKLRSRAHYNLAIAMGYSGLDYDEAMSALQKAMSIHPDKVYTEQMIKIREFKADTERLKQQGVEVNISERCSFVEVVS